MADELEEIRKKKLQELQQQAEYQESMEEQQKEQHKQVEEQKKRILRAILTNPARERLARIKISRPQTAESIETQLIMLAQSGQIKNKINDEQLKMILKKMLPKKRDITIKRR